MSDLLINIRVGLYHFKLTKIWTIKVSKNEYHRGYPYGFFQIHEFNLFRK